MKKLILSTMIAAAAAIPALAGVNDVNYQAVIKNGNGVVANQAVAMKFELLNGEEVVWEQEQNPTTNANGFVACQLGDGIDAVDWNADLTLKVSVNLGNGFQVISNEAVASVPSALRSADAQELYPVVEKLMLDNENTKETLLGVNASIAQMEGFIEDVEVFNDRVSEALEPLMGLNYEEISEFNQRVSEELAKLQGLNYEELDDYLDRVNAELIRVNEVLEDTNATTLAEYVTKLNALVETLTPMAQKLEAIDNKIEEFEAFNDRLSETLEPMIGLNYEEINDFHERVSETLTANNEAIDELNTNTEAFADMVEERFDKVQGNVDANTTSIEQLTEQIDQFATMNETRLDKIQNQLDETDKTAEENYDDLKGLITRNEQSISVLQGKVNENYESYQEDFQKMSEFQEGVTGSIEGINNDIKLLKDSIKLITDPSDPDSIMNTMSDTMASFEEEINGKINAVDEKVTTLQDTLDQLVEALRDLDVLPTTFGK